MAATSRRTCARCGPGSTRPPAPPGGTRRRSRCSPSARPGRPPTCGPWPRSGSGTSARTGPRSSWTRRPQLTDPADRALRWHFIGQLQRNKAAAVARLGAVVHSVDRESLARVLDRVGQERDRPVEVFVQVDLGGPEGELGDAGRPAPGRRPRAGRPGRRVGRPAAARAHGRGAARRATRARRSTAWPRSPPGCGPTTPRRSTVGGHERRPGGGDRSRRDGRACRNRVVRGSAPTLR